MPFAVVHTAAAFLRRAAGRLSAAASAASGAARQHMLRLRRQLWPPHVLRYLPICELVGPCPSDQMESIKATQKLLSWHRVRACASACLWATTKLEAAY